MKFIASMAHSFQLHFNSHRVTVAQIEKEGKAADRREIPWPFLILQASVLTVIWVGWSPVAVAAAITFYFIRMFGITGVYHRYFSHRTYKTSRTMQFILAFLGNTAAQRGPLWWSAHHRHHHRFSDQPGDTHSPRLMGFWESHMGWWMRRRNVPTHLDRVRDLTKFPELMFLDRFDSFAPIVFGVFCFGFGWGLNALWPSLGTSGLQMLVWGFVISTVVLFHGVATINSLAHVFGGRRFATTDDSRNNFFLALVTLGEGWHNNHHHYQNSVRQGFFWYEIDITFYALKAMSWLGLVWDLKPIPPRFLLPQDGLNEPPEVNGNLVATAAKDAPNQIIQIPTIAIKRPHEHVPGASEKAGPAVEETLSHLSNN